MSDSQPAAELPELNRFRGYLQVLAQIELSPRLRAKVDASDIVQQSLLEAHQGLGAFRGRSEAELAAWLRMILARNLLNTARDYGAAKRDVRRELPMAQRIEQSSVRLDQFLAAQQTSPSQCVLRSERSEKLAVALADLPEDQRRAVILKHFHDWSLAEIAAEMDRTTMAVAGLLKRGLKKLRTLLDDAQ